MVNDSLIMVDYVNRKVIDGMKPSEASVAVSYTHLTLPTNREV